MHCDENMTQLDVTQHHQILSPGLWYRFLRCPQSSFASKSHQVDQVQFDIKYIPQ